MEKKKIHIIVSGGRVESVLCGDDIEVEVIDCDVHGYEDEHGEMQDYVKLQDYINSLRAQGLREVIC